MLNTDERQAHQQLDAHIRTPGGPVWTDRQTDRQAGRQQAAGLTFYKPLATDDADKCGNYMNLLSLVCLHAYCMAVAISPRVFGEGVHTVLVGCLELNIS